MSDKNVHLNKTIEKWASTYTRFIHVLIHVTYTRTSLYGRFGRFLIQSSLESDDL